uniref:Nucleotide-diphospho-sugar transferase domain-containing protein n=2 Tax=Wuchereria bancrofti TaxID=6293 RepID=A0AAF5PX44_WUCBA
MHAAQLLDYCPRNSRIDEFVDSAISAAKRSTTSKQLNSDISIRQRINKNIDNSVQSSSSPSSSLSSSSSSPSSSLSSLPSLNSTTINDTSSDNNQTNNTRFGLKNSKNSILLRFSEIFYRLCCYGTYLLWFSIGILAIRKTLNATAAVRYVKEHRHTVSEEVIATSSTFQQLLWSLDHEFSKPPAIFLLNQHALNMTFNFLCNTRDMNGVHERLIFITLDEVAKDVLNEYWPNIRQVYWPTPSLYKPFSFAEGAYQTLYLLRANMAVCLLKNGKSFWMMQQDTFWLKNIFDLGLEENYEYDAIFDQIGFNNVSQRAEWINGANFFVRANNSTVKFFEAVARKLAHWYTPDMGIMIHQCHTWKEPKCSYIPHKIANSWEWMYTNQKNPPYILQLDCETDGGSKLMQLAKFGFYFMNSDNHRICNQTAVDVARKRMEDGKIEVSRTRLSWGRFQFKVYWWIVDRMLSVPILGTMMKPYLPLIGFIVMITI